MLWNKLLSMRAPQNALFFYWHHDVWCKKEIENSEEGCCDQIDTCQDLVQTIILTSTNQSWTSSSKIPPARTWWLLQTIIKQRHNGFRMTMLVIQDHANLHLSRFVASSQYHIHANVSYNSWRLVVFSNSCVIVYTIYSFHRPHSKFTKTALHTDESLRRCLAP